MATLQPYATPGTFSAKALRLAQSTAFMRGATAITARSGIVGAASYAVTQTGSPSMAVSVAAGQLVFQGTVGADQGLYACTNDAAVTVNLAAAPVGNPRIDLIYGLLTDQTDGAGSGYTLTLDKVTGTPAASPSPPAVPTEGFALAQVAVAVGAANIVNANITDRRQHTATLGGVLPCTSTTRPSHSEGLFIYETDTDLVQVSNGSAWRQIRPDGPRGLMATPAGSATSTSTTTTTEIKDSQVGDYTFTVVSGRVYVAHYSGRIQSDASGSTVDVKIRDGGGSSPTNASTLLAASSIYLAQSTGAGATTLRIDQVLTGLSAGTHILAAFFLRTAGSGNVQIGSSASTNRQLWVEDIGT